MRKALLTVAVVAVSLSLAVSAFAITKESRRLDGGSAPYGLSQDCLLQAYNSCAGWVWVYGEAPGAIWGQVMDPNDCAGGCTNGGAVSDIWFWGYCSPSAPAIVADIGVSLIDAVACPTVALWNSGPVTVYSCIYGDRWTHVTVPIADTHLDGNEFAVMFTWGPSDPIMLLASDQGVGNLFCWMGDVGSPGCAATDLTCAGWCCPPPAQLFYIYYTDWNADTILDDLCDINGAPYPYSFPYVNYYGYMPNNLMVLAGLDCHSPTAVENTSWGHVKALYE